MEEILTRVGIIGCLFTFIGEFLFFTAILLIKVGLIRRWDKTRRNFMELLGFAAASSIVMVAIFGLVWAGTHIYLYIIAGAVNISTSLEWLTSILTLVMGAWLVVALFRGAESS